MDAMHPSWHTASLTGSMCASIQVGQIMFQDLFNKTSPISVRDYRAAFVDKLSASQIDAIYLSNTKYLDDLPELCRGDDDGQD